MNTWSVFYDWLEKTFWNSLSKKLASLLLLYLFNLGYVLIYLDQQAALPKHWRVVR